jgi:hypothetical protein
MIGMREEVLGWAGPCKPQRYLDLIINVGEALKI